MIPEITKPQWGDLINGKLNVSIQSFALQMKVNTLRTSYKNNLVSLPDAIQDLHGHCVKYERVYLTDLNNIFK